MATEAYTHRPAARSWPRAELVLALLAVASLALIPIRITTIYSDLPAHPLFLHVPVILIPLLSIAGLGLAIRPSWFPRYGVLFAAVAVIALAGTFLTVGAGFALRAALHLRSSFGPGATVARHAHIATILRDLMIAFTAVSIVAVLAHRVAAGRPTGRGAIDKLLSGTAARGSIRIGLAALAIACGGFVFRTGDLGAKAVWQGRLNHRAPLGPDAPADGFPFGPGSGPTGP